MSSTIQSTSTAASDAVPDRPLTSIGIAPFSYTRRLVTNTVAVLSIDILAMLVALLLGGFLRYALRGDAMVPPWTWLFVPVWIIGAMITGLAPGWGLGPVDHVRRLFVLVCAAFGIAAAALFLSKTGAEASRFTLTTAFLISLLLVPLARTRMKGFLIYHGWWGVPTVIYGSDESASHVLEALRNEAGLGYIPVGIFDDDSEPGSYIGGVAVLGALHENAREAPFAIITTAQTSRERLIELLEGPLASYRRVVLIPDLLDAPSLWVTPRDFLGLVGLEVALNLLNPISRFSKRFVDVALTISTAPVWMPLCLFIALMIWLEDRRSPMFFQERIGYGGARFNTWKFRTMRTDAEAVLEKKLAEDPALEAEWAVGFKLKDDPRITRVGDVLRRTSLDELPQLINVLRGEMSLVGPRPLPDYHYEGLPHSLRSLRDRVRPGMTGLWQVSGRSDSGIQGMERWDAYYVRNWSIWLDAVILVRTLRAVSSGQGAY